MYGRAGLSIGSANRPSHQPLAWVIVRSQKVLSPGPEVWLSRAGRECLRHRERWLILARRRIAANVLSVRHARVDPELSGSLKSQGFRRQCEGFCQARAPFAASHPVSCSASKVGVYSPLGCRNSAH